MRVALAFWLCFTALPAGAGTLHGTWCGPQEIFYIDATGIGASEHTFCKATPPPAANSVAYSAALSCKNVYPGEQQADGTFAVTEVPLDTPTRIVAMQVTGNRLAVVFDNDTEGMLLDNCD